MSVSDGIAQLLRLVRAAEEELLRVRQLTGMDRSADNFLLSAYTPLTLTRHFVEVALANQKAAEARDKGESDGTVGGPEK